MSSAILRPVSEDRATHSEEGVDEDEESNEEEEEEEEEEECERDPGPTMHTFYDAEAVYAVYLTDPSEVQGLALAI
jgi:hypothetical protein